jgi:hypothetical protein
MQSHDFDLSSQSLVLESFSRSMCQQFLSGFRKRPASPLGKKDFGQNYFNRCPVIMQ